MMLTADGKELEDQAFCWFVEDGEMVELNLSEYNILPDGKRIGRKDYEMISPFTHTATTKNLYASHSEAVRACDTYVSKLYRQLEERYGWLSRTYGLEILPKEAN